MSFHWKKLLIIGLLAIVFIVPPLVMEIGTATMNLLIMLFIFIILSQSWNLMGGYTGQINLGLAAFFGCGLLVTHFIWKAEIPIYFAVIAGGLSAVVLAGIIGLPTSKAEGCLFCYWNLRLGRGVQNSGRQYFRSDGQNAWLLCYRL